MLGNNESAGLEIIQHACVLFQYQNTTILLDPWLTDNFNYGVFHAHPSVQPVDYKRLQEVNAIHISHLHADHFCAKSLENFNKKTPIIIALHKNRHFYESIKKLGFEEIIEVAPGPQGLLFKDIKLNIFTAQTQYPFDSSIVITANDSSYLFDNDARFSEDHYFILGQYFKKFEGAFVGYADISPFPTCYDFSKCKNIKNSTLNNTLFDHIKKSSFKRIQMICEHLSPRWVTPYAAGIRFRNQNLIHYNKMFFELDEFFELNLGSTIPIYLQPGQKVSLNTNFHDFGIHYYHNSLKSVVPIDKSTFSFENTHLSDFEISHFEEFYIHMIREESKNWLCPLHIAIKIQNDEKFDHQFNLYFDGSNVTRSESNTDLDLEIIYSRESIKNLLSHRWNLTQVHYTYQWKAIVHNIVPGQMGIPQWGKTVKLLNIDHNFSKT